MRKLFLATVFIGSSLVGVAAPQVLAADQPGQRLAQWQTRAKDSQKLAMQLGYAYFKGLNGVTKNIEQAIDWLTKTCEFDENEDFSRQKAAYLLAGIYQGEYGVAADETKQIYFLKLASEAIEQTGFIDAPYRLSKLVKDDAQYRTYLEKSARAGHIPAMYQLAVDFGSGNRMSASDEGFMYWMTKVADKGIAQAQGIVGDAYFNGSRTYKDYGRAFEWLSKAAAQGDADAQLELGLIYDLGLGRAQDKTKASKWYGLSASAGNTIALENLASILVESKDPKDNQKGISYLTTLAKSGVKSAASRLSAIYNQGTIVSKDTELAAYWYDQADSMDEGPQGQIIGKTTNEQDEASYSADSRALSLARKGLEYLNKDDYEPAAKLFEKAARMNLPIAQYNLAIVYYKMFVKQRDETLLVNCYAWAKLAAYNGVGSAAEMVDFLNDKGTSVLMNKGIQLYNRLKDEIDSGV